MLYKLFIQNSGGSLYWEIPYLSFSFKETLNSDREANIKLDYQAVKAIADIYLTTVEQIVSGSYRELLIYNEAGTKVYGGYISEVNLEQDGKNNTVLIISSKGFFSLLEKRFTDDSEIYTTQDAGDIAWDLINTSQSLTYGDFGITRGSHPTTSDHDRTFRYKNIKKAIEGLSNAEIKNGYDFEIDNDKVFNIYYPFKGSYKNNLVLEENFNIKSITIQKTFIDSMVNQVYVLGADVGTDQVVVTRNSDTAYKSAFFLLQGSLSEKDSETTDTLNNKGDAFLEKYKAPLKIISIDCEDNNPTLTDYSVGDYLKINYSSFGINDFYRLNSRRVADNGDVTLQFSII